MKNILGLVLSGSSYYEPFVDLGFTVINKDSVRVEVEDLEKVNIVLFTGGTDVNPELYGKSRNTRTNRPDRMRDQAEVDIFNYCKENNIPMVGICRGFQFLNVMNGGEMYQDVTGHAGRNHSVDVFLGTTITGSFIVNSYHHQMVNPNEQEAIVLAKSSARLSDHYLGESHMREAPPEYEVESCYFPESNSAGVQWHPEWMDQRSEAAIFFKELCIHVLNVARTKK